MRTRVNFVKCCVDGCDSASLANRMCDTHYRRFRKTGSVEPPKPRESKLRKFIDEVIAAENGSDCVTWPYSCDRYGYGQVRVNGNPGRAHRLVLSIITGKPYDYPLMVRHTCGNGHLGCVNPLHLEWGTAKDNAQDRLRDGTVEFGEDNNSAALTNAQAIAIAQDSRSYAIIAKDYGIGKSTVARIKTGQAWSTVTGIST